MHTCDKSRKRIKRVARTHFQPFSCIFDSYHVCACVIAYFQSFLRPRTHTQVSVPVFVPECSFLTHFQLLLSIFSCFYLFLTIFTYSLSNLPIFDRLYLFSTVFTQIRVLLLIFTYFFLSFFIFLNSFSTIFE